jgi:hypothetical protein
MCISIKNIWKALLLKQSSVEAICFYFCLVFTTANQAQIATPTIVTDRPAYSETPFTLGKNIYQIETGWRLDKLEKEAKVYLPKAWLRGGITQKLEWRAGLNTFVLDGEQSIKTEPLELGFKYLTFLKENKRAHSFSLNAAIPLNKSNNLITFYPRFIGNHSNLFGSFGISYTAGMSLNQNNTFGFGTFKIDKSFAHQLNIFAEIYAETTSNIIGSLALSQVFKDNWQWDISAGLNNTTSFYTAFGLSKRIIAKK